MAAPLFLLNEEEYFLMLSRGDEAAFEIIFNYYSARIYPFVHKMTRSEENTKEIVQDVFINLWKARDKIPEISNYSAYIYTIATNLTYNFLKSKAREIVRIKELKNIEKEFDDNVNEAIDLKERKEALNQLVNKLPPQQKLIFQLTRDYGLSHNEISEKLGISRNTVKNHLVKALKYLRENLYNSSDTVALIFIVALICLVLI